MEVRLNEIPGNPWNKLKMNVITGLLTFSFIPKRKNTRSNTRSASIYFFFFFGDSSERLYSINTRSPQKRRVGLHLTLVGSNSEGHVNNFNQSPLRACFIQYFVPLPRVLRGEKAIFAQQQCSSLGSFGLKGGKPFSPYEMVSLWVTLVMYETFIPSLNYNRNEENLIFVDSVYLQDLKHFKEMNQGFSE